MPFKKQQKERETKDHDVDTDDAPRRRREPKSDPEPPVAPIPAPVQVPVALRLNARQFTKAKRIRWDRAAGFLHWCRKKYGENKRLTTKEWLPIWNAFNATPVSGSKGDQT